MKKMLFGSVKKELFPTPNKLILYKVILYIFDDRAYFGIVGSKQADATLRTWSFKSNMMHSAHVVGNCSSTLPYETTSS